MTTSTHQPSVSRRTALAGLGAGGLGLALAATARRAAAQDAATDLAEPPDDGHLAGDGQPAAAGRSPGRRPVPLRRRRDRCS